MRKQYYIIIANNITGMGGVHQYCRNKLQEVRKKGYIPILFSGNKGRIYIPELQEFKTNVFAELKYPPYCFTSKRVRKVVRCIISKCSNIGPESIIECLTVAAAEWGEIIAKDLTIKCLAFILDEHPIASSGDSMFLRFKHERRELAAISRIKYRELLSSCCEIHENDAQKISAVCSNVLADYPYDIPFPLNGYIIGSIGRLEKNYVIPMLKGIVEYTSNRLDNNFTLILIGGTDNKHLVRKIKSQFKKQPNVKLFITGYIYPIPKKLIDCLNVAIGSAGSAKVTALDADIPTISIDTNTARPIGILNYTTKTSLFDLNECNQLSISQLLEDILEHKVCNDLDKLGMKSPIDRFPEEVERQFKTFVKTGIKKEYYDVQKIKPGTLQFTVYSLIGHLLGGVSLSFIHRHLIHPLKKYLKCM